MEKQENQKVISSRDRIRDRYSKKFPERNFGEENEQNALDDLAIEELEDLDARLGEYRAHSQKLTDMFSGNPKAAQMFMHMVGGGNPIQYFIENFGDEFIDAMNSEEGKKMFLESQDKWLKKVADSKRMDEEAEKNFAESIKALEQFQQEKGLSDDEAVAVFEKVYKIATDMVLGIYTAETFQMAYDAMNYSNDVARAREEGEINGRNAKVEEKLRKGRAPQSMPPSLAGGASEPVQRVAAADKPEKVGAWGIPVYKRK